MYFFRSDEIIYLQITIFHTYVARTAGIYHKKIIVTGVGLCISLFRRIRRILLLNTSSLLI